MVRDLANQKGAIVILFAIGLVMLIGIGALVVDIGYGLVVKSELQNVSDAGTLAGTRELALIYDRLGETCTTATGNDCYWGTHPLSSSERLRIEAKIKSFTQANQAGGVPISIAPSDILYGKLPGGQLQPVGAAYKGVTGIGVTAHRSASANTLLSTVLGNVLGTSSMSVSANSGSSLSALAKVPAGGISIPVGISKSWWGKKARLCGSADDAAYSIDLLPVSSSEVVWNAFTYDVSTSDLSNLHKILGGVLLSPETVANSTIYQLLNLTNTSNTWGKLSSSNSELIFNEMYELFNRLKGNNLFLETVVPVYETTCDLSREMCPRRIVAFTTLSFSPDSFNFNTVPKSIKAAVTCNVVDTGEGGGADYGTLFGRPAMVQ